MPHPATRLTIPRPCSQSWAAMVPTGPGRRCAACQKVVVDFTRKTDAEILAYLAQADRGNTCGRFRAGQLARPLAVAAPARPAARWQAWLTGVLLATLALPSCRHPLGEPRPVATAPSARFADGCDSCAVAGTTILATDSVAVAADSASAPPGELMGDVEELP
ncbi:hypothetical protein HHL22_17810 [Hymenobacter sp. RP-2-7]|uniref:Uncharacterized protein n=1 Tax=Hymenobacter polaris TaxID=2682546 RepID=A0A7Y0FNY4_9BACT|nr:hypothetical protein [Hymenobacter polaris]NML67066.1 hypothetical protein [Hymenobacter polaris]